MVDILFSKFIQWVILFLDSIKNNTNCILTPHIAGVTEESNARVSEFITNAVIKFFKL